MSYLDVQIGGSHYINMPIQPLVFCKLNNLGPHETKIIKYLCRYKNKDGIGDLCKARDVIQKLIEHEINEVDVRTSYVCEDCFNKHLVAKTFGYECLDCGCACHKNKEYNNCENDS